MLKIKKRVIINLIGIFYLLLGIVAIINTIYQEDLAPILWFCYIGVLLLGIGALRKDDLLVASQLNILTIPLIIWSIDLVYGMVFGQTLFGVVDYFFLPGPLIGKLISLQHLFTIPLGFFLLSLISLKRKDVWKVSFAELIIVFSITRLFTAEAYNINCVYMPCINLSIGAGIYPFVWFALSFLGVFLINLMIVKLFVKERKG
tara:strand:+ start:2227 stop:2835 length:609 start_codon:yes stop_codon:yes gene_type:complete